MIAWLFSQRRESLGRSPVTGNLHFFAEMWPRMGPSGGIVIDNSIREG